MRLYAALGIRKQQLGCRQADEFDHSRLLAIFRHLAENRSGEDAFSSRTVFNSTPHLLIFLLPLSTVLLRVDSF